MQRVWWRARLERCAGRNAIGVILLFGLTLFLSGCSGGGGASQVVEGPPAAPTGVTFAFTGSNELTLSWNGVGGASSYNVYWATAPGANKSSANWKKGITSTSFVHTGLTNGGTYYYVVTAVNSFGESSASGEVSALLDIPLPPEGLATVAGDGQVTLNWNTNGAASYNIYMASQTGVTRANYAMLPDGAKYTSTGGSYTATGLVNGKTYYFAVTTVNSFGEGTESREVSATPAASGTLSVSGSVKYEDKQYGAGGFTGTTFFKAVRFAEVQAVDAVTGATIVTGATDGFGSYSLAIPAASGSREIYVRVISSSSSPAIDVKDLSNAFHAVAGANFVASGAAASDIFIQAANLAAGAFNILDVYVSGALFVQSLSGSYPPALSAFWPNYNGTYFCTGAPDFYCPYGEGIYALNSTTDTDEFDDDVLWHEYGHFVASKYSRDESPGGVHYLTSNDLDLRLSWSEGWANSFQAAVKVWLTANTPDVLSADPALSAAVYVDTMDGMPFAFDFLNPGGFPYFYASSEVAVARVLLSVSASHGIQAVWDAFSSSYVMAATPVNAEVFWESWNSLGKADISAILNERLIKYSADQYEASGDNAPNPGRKFANGESHTLFGSGDIDVIAFDAIAGQTYTIKTSTLRNGADTYVTVIAPDQITVVANNDNQNNVDYSLYPFVPNNCDMYGECHENGFDILGSVATFTATSSGTYYAEVKSSQKRPPSAGKYGEYVLTITAP